jgi:GNAT superfamily N-acetyltransferase
MRTMLGVETILLSAAQVTVLADQFSAVYRAAFAGPPYHRQDGEAAEFRRVLPRHAERPDFRCVGALNVDSGEIVGFAYGYRSLAGQWWRDNVAHALDRRVANEWLSDAFQVVEIAVTPAHQGRGLGGALHDHLLIDLPHASAVLSTIDAKTVARHLYLHRGWQEILTGFRFPGVARPYTIMGLPRHPNGAVRAT